MIRRKHLLASLVLGLLAFAAPLFSSIPATALSGSDFNAGRIVDDGIFFNPGGMSVDQIQAFLNAKVPTCDTNGSQASSHWNGSRYYTRAEWGTMNGNPGPYTCLKDYRMDVPNRGPDAYCSGGISGGNKSAAQVIGEVALACSINPQTILVILQKEQGLVGDDWPWRDQYAAAMGFACPDTAACDTQYAGLFNQIYNGARQYQRYAKQADVFNYKMYRSNLIAYNPSSNCGASSVYINSQATAGLYNYTPYQPNQAALNNLYGTGDNCSAYGNRNFWRLFSDWFGNTQTFNANIIMSQGLTTNATSSNVYMGDNLTASFEVSNTADYAASTGGLGICARLNGQNYDLGFIDQTLLPAHGKKTVSFTKKLDASGSLQLFTCSYHASIGGWASSFYPYATSSTSNRTANLQVQENPLIASSVSFSPAAPTIGQPITASFTIRNNSNTAVSLGNMVVAARDKNGYNADFPADNGIMIAPNSTYTYSKTRTMVTFGNYSYFVANFNGYTWNSTNPRVADSSVARSGTLYVEDNPLITNGVSFSPASPAAGQAVTATFSIRNTSASAVPLGMVVLAARSSNGSNVDFPADPNVTIAAGATYTYSQSRSFTSPGQHSFYIANFNNNVWSTNFPKSQNGSIIRAGTVTVRDNPQLTSSVSFSPSNPKVGQAVTATFTIRNDSASPVNVGLLVLAARDKNGYNADLPGDDNITIAPNSTYTYSKSRVMVTPGPYKFYIANLNNGAWSSTYPKSADPSFIRSGSFTVAP